MSNCVTRLAHALLSFVLVFIVAGFNAMGQSPPTAFTQTISTSSQSLTVDFTYHPIRSANFKVLVQQADGSFLTYAAEIERTYLGTVRGKPGAIACGLLKADGTLWARIGLEDGTTWTTTGGTASTSGGTTIPQWPTTVMGNGGAGSSVYAAEVGIDSTNNHFTACGGTVDGVVNQCEFSIMSTNMVYLRDAAILHRIGTIIVRADASQDPYAVDGGNTSNLLPHIRTLWNTSAPMGSTHDIAAVIHSAANGGLAYVGVVGTSSRYSADDSDGSGDFSVVWRHEVGHNWGSSHYEGGGNPEGSTIMSNNALSRFSSSELKKMVAHRNSKSSVLDNLGNYNFALPPRANQDATTYLRGMPKRVDVLANDSDSNGQALSILSFDSVSNLGAALTRSVGTGPGGRDEILYTPPATLSAGTDWFIYRIQDAAGMQAMGYAMLRPTSEILNPLDHWLLDETSGATAVDRIRTTQNGTHQNAVVVGQTGANSVTRKGAYFDGINDQTSIPAPNYNTNVLTFTAWVKRDGSQIDSSPIIYTRAGSSVAGFHFGAANELRYTWDSGGWTWNSGLVVPDKTWCLVAMCVSPSGTTLFLRTPTSLQSASYSLSQAAEAFNGVMYLGYDSINSIRHFKGWLDDVRVYGATLNSDEIESLYQQATNPPSVSLTAPLAGASLSPLDVLFSASISTQTDLVDTFDFMENGSILASASEFPWQASLESMSPGVHTVTAYASFGDWDYQAASQPVTFTTQNAPLPVVTVAASLPASKSGPISGSFTFTRDHSIGSITIPFSLGGTAVAGTDYDAIPTSVTLADGILAATITVNPIVATPDTISETLILTLAAGADYTLGSPSSATLTIDDHITSIASDEWDVATTWNSNVAAPTSGTQNTGPGYGIAHTVSSNNNASNSQAFIAGYLRVKSGGVLDLARLHATTTQNVSYNLPKTYVEDGGTIKFRCSVGSSAHTVAANLSMTGNTTLRLNGGSYDDDATLTGTVSGSGNISVISDTSAGGGTYVRQVSINHSNNPFSGNWIISHTGGGNENAALRAYAANALGNGSVTVGLSSQLINDAASGLNSLNSIILNGAGSSLLLNQPWNNSTASLSLSGGSPSVVLGNAASSIGSLSGSVGSIYGTGASSALTVNQTNDRIYSGNLGASLRFTKSGPALLALAGSLDTSLVLSLTNGVIIPPVNASIASFTQSGGNMQLNLPSTPASQPSLSLSGALAYTSGTITVNVTSALVEDTPYTLISYQGTRSGTPAIVVNDHTGSGLLPVISYGSGSNSAVTILFIQPPPPEYTLTYSAGNGGFISGAADQVVIEGHDGDAVTATPNVGYSFVQWSDGSTNATRMETNVTAGLSVTASFTLNQYTLSYTTDGPGSITGSNTQIVDHGSDGQSVTAVPNSGAYFVAWSDGLTSPQRNEMQVTGPISVSAKFLTGSGPISIANSPWSMATTWSHDLAAPVIGTQGSGFSYIVDTFTVGSNDPSSNNQAMIGSTVEIRNHGILDLVRDHSGALQTVTYSLPPLALAGPATLRFRATNGGNLHLVSAPITTYGNTTLLVTGGNDTNNVTLSGVFSGSGTVAVISDTDATSVVENLRSISFTAPNSTFAGNWTVNHTATTGDDFAALIASGANTLGSGTVTIGTRARLINQIANGINSLAGVSLTGINSRLTLTQPWNNTSASLTLGDESVVVEVGDATSSVGQLMGTGGTIQGTGAASRLIVHQLTDTTFGGNLSGSLQFEQTGSAKLCLAGTNQHSGETRVSAGTLSGTGSSSSALVVSDGATLLAETGHFHSASVSFASGSIFSVHFNSDSLTAGQISAAGTVVIDPTSNLVLTDDGDAILTDGAKLVLLDYSGQQLTGTFAGLPEGASITVAANSFIISYHDTVGGTGNFITLTADVPNPYQDWIDSYVSITDPAMKDPSADADSDGLANLIEYAVGANPTVFTASPFTADVVANALVITFDRVKTTGCQVDIEYGQDLAAWSVATAGMTQVTDHTTTETVIVTVPIPNGADKLFARLRVVGP